MFDRLGVRSGAAGHGRFDNRGPSARPPPRRFSGLGSATATAAPPRWPDGSSRVDVDFRVEHRRHVRRALGPRRPTGAASGWASTAASVSIARTVSAQRGRASRRPAHRFDNRRGGHSTIVRSRSATASTTGSRPLMAGFSASSGRRAGPPAAPVEGRRLAAGPMRRVSKAALPTSRFDFRRRVDDSTTAMAAARES